MTQQQRAHKRYDLRLSAEVQSEGRTFTATTRNLSAGGCCLESPFPLADDAELSLSLFIVIDGIEDERMPPLATRGTVQWTAPTDSDEHAAGIRFTGMTDAQSRWLEQFLARSGQE